MLRAELDVELTELNRPLNDVSISVTIADDFP
jgi:hypothetical protein